MIVAFITFLVVFINLQAPGVSDVNPEIKRILAFSGQYPDSSQQELTRFLSTITDPGQEADVYLAIGKVQSIKREFLGSAESILKARQIADSMGLRDRLAATYKDIGTIYFFLRNYQKALESYEKLHIIAKELSDSTLLGYAYNNLGLAHANLSNIPSAVEYFTAAIRLKQVYKPDTISIIRSWINISSAWEKEKSYQKVLQASDSAFILANKINNPYLLAILYYNNGNAWSLLGDFDKALASIQKSMAEQEKISNAYLRIETYSLYATILNRMKAYSQARTMFEKGISLAEKMEQYDFLIEMLKEYSSLEEILGRFNEANKLFRRHIELSDSMLINSQMERIAQLYANYDIQMREKENDVLKANIELTELAVSRQNLLIYLMAAILLLTFAITWLVYRQNRLKTRLMNEITEINGRLQEANITRDRLFSIISHDLRNLFSTVQMSSDLLSQRINTMSAEKREQFLNSLSVSVTQTVNLLENLLQWGKTQMKSLEIRPESIDVGNLFSLQDDLFREQLKQKQVTVRVDCQGGITVYADFNMISTALRNLISNAIKFSQPGGTVILDAAALPDGSKEIRVTDAGVGMTKEQVGQLFQVDKTFTLHGTAGEAGSGLGLILSKEFVEKNNGSLLVHSEPGKGSTFTIRFGKNG